MKLQVLDWIVIVAYFAISLGIGLAFRKRAGKGLVEYFAAGRSLPWWIVGTGMVATTFAADTPLVVTGLTVKGGLQGNWVWWAGAMGGMVTVFIYARLWRRAQVLTDQEVVELRYAGKPAAFLRGFRAAYFALPINCIVIGWVTKAMVVVLRETVLYSPAVAGVEAQAGVADWIIILISLVVVGLYSVLSGMWGVAITDVIQFVIAMAGCIILAIISVNSVGGMEALKTGVLAHNAHALEFIPTFNAGTALYIFLVYMFVQWWASWYPGQEPGGGGYVVQRMASARTEKDSLLATLWFQTAHYCIRPWPWVIVAFAIMVKYPDLLLPGVSTEQIEAGYPRIMRDLLPTGLAGLLIVAFFAAFMSTLSTQINWGASYLVSDIYKRFMRPDATDAQLATASRWASLLVLCCGGATAYFIVEYKIPIGDVWKALLALGAGTGAVYMLRWFWWRINAWSEITAMLASLAYFLLSSRIYGVIVNLASSINPAWKLPEELIPEYQLVLVTALTIPTWLIVTFLTGPEASETLDRFYTKIHPSRAGWGPVAARLPHVESKGHIGISVLCAILGAAVVYLTLPGIGFLIFGQHIRGIACLAGALACGGGIVFLLNRAGWATVAR